MKSLQLITGDLWEYHRAGAVVAITTGGLIKRDGCCTMPSGCAREAADRYPRLPFTLGEQIRRFGLHVFDLGNRIVAFPVEHSPYENPEPAIIARSCRELVELAAYKGWSRIVVPRPGCGKGGLAWDEIKPILAAHFDSRFLVIAREETHETR